MIEWLYVPGARRTSSCNNGWAGSPSSIKLKSVCTPNTRSTIGKRHVISEPATIAHSPHNSAVFTNGTSG